jgi:hypothetical protein
MTADHADQAAPARAAPGRGPFDGVDPAATRQRLRRLVLKNAVGLGGLADAERQLALALAWAGLPTDAGSERLVNEALRATLAGAACWLDVDHVELRRWLVDTGWLQRDAYGRVYARVARASLNADRQALVGALDALAREGLGHRDRAADDAAAVDRADPDAAHDDASGTGLAAWIAQQRAADAAQKAARRAAWQGAQAAAGAVPGPGTGGAAACR